MLGGGFLYGFIVGFVTAIALFSIISCFWPGSTSPTQPGYTRIIGSGSTFVKPAMDAWIKGFENTHPGVRIDYLGGGSGKGVSDLLDGLVDFACSDPPLPRSKWLKLRGDVIQFPVVLGAIVVVYNVPEIRGVTLNLSGQVIAGIYMGKVAYWDDPAIKELNPGVAEKLPHKPIIAIHRSDASGTTELFTLYLSKTSPEWARRVGWGKTVEWPVDSTGRGIGQEGNQGVTQALLSTPYSIGYVEWAYALEYKLNVAKLMNPYGVFVAPSTASIASVFIKANLPSPLDDWSNITPLFIYSNSSSNAYPLVGQTFMIVKREWSDTVKCRTMKAFIEYVMANGQNALPKGYVPLPPTLRKLAREAASLLDCSKG